MNDNIYKVFYKHNVLFLSNPHDYTSSSLINMMKSFDVYYYENDFLWYRLKKNACIIDEKSVLEPYNEEVNLIKLFEYEQPLDRIKTENWIDEKTFYKMREQGRLNELLEELCYDSFESDISYTSSFCDSE